MRKLEDAATHLKAVDNIVGSIDYGQINVNSIFDEETVSFVKELSSTIRSNKYCRQYPDIMSLAFWSRKANIEFISNSYLNSNESRIGRGLCFHVAPSNVPVTFAFSFLFSLLAGNSNIVRIPSNKFPQTEVLLEIINELFQKYPCIGKNNLFCRYDKNNFDASIFISELSDCRIIWGGDSTVEIFKKMKTKSRCIDICFADRYSFSVIDALAVKKLSDDKLERLAKDFVNDSYTMNQNACSSPHLIVWINGDESGRNRFWSSVKSVVDKKIHFSGATAFEKYNNFCEFAVNLNIREFYHHKNLLYLMELDNLQCGLEQFRGKDGAFLEYCVNDFSELFKVINEKYQTVTYFGVKPQKIFDLMSEYGCLGIDRIVPIGKALDMTYIWDGFDTIRSLSRVVYLD